MRKNQKIRIALVFFIYRPEIRIHLWTNSGACSKKKFCYIHFALYILIRDTVPVLIKKRKRLHFIQYRQANLSKTGDNDCHKEIESGKQEKEKQGIEPDFLGHVYKNTFRNRVQKV